MNNFMLASAIGASMMLAQVANAQDALFDDVDAANVSAACGGGDAAACLAAINLIVANLQAAGLSASELNIQLAALASTLADVARDNPVASVLLATSQALQAVANTSTDPAQQAAILTLATAVASGQIPDQTTVLTSTTPVSGA
jgi:hypothetical protein